MSGDICLAHEHLATDIAAMLPFVHLQVAPPYMCIEQIYRWVTLPTMVAEEQLLRAVGNHVREQSTPGVEALAAFATQMRFLFVVKTHVSVSVRAGSESLFAHITFVRLFTGVTSHVDLKQLGYVKGLATLRAQIPRACIVRVHVGIQTATVRVSLIAYCALEVVFHGMGSYVLI